MSLRALQKFSFEYSKIKLPLSSHVSPTAVSRSKAIANPITLQQSCNVQVIARLSRYYRVDDVLLFTPTCTSYPSVISQHHQLGGRTLCALFVSLSASASRGATLGTRSKTIANPITSQNIAMFKSLLGFLATTALMTFCYSLKVIRRIRLTFRNVINLVGVLCTQLCHLFASEKNNTRLRTCTIRQARRSISVSPCEPRSE